MGNSGSANNKDGGVAVSKERLAMLPPQISPLLNCSKKSKQQPHWDYKGDTTLGYYFREVQKQTDDWNTVAELIGKLGEGTGSLEISKIVSLHNPTLLRTFTSQLSFFETRVTEDPQLFQKQTWLKKGTKQEDKDLRKHIYDKYTSHASAFDWNNGRVIPIVPAIQRVKAESDALDIAHTGFQMADPSSDLSAFKFGQGLYFTTDSLFAAEPTSQSNSAILVLCLTIPGNVYPVIEQHDSETVSLMGSPVVAGYNSHYVLTTKDGKAITCKEETHSDQLVVAQESQVLPVFIIQVNRP